MKVFAVPQILLVVKVPLDSSFFPLIKTASSAVRFLGGGSSSI